MSFTQPTSAVCVYLGAVFIYGWSLLRVSRNLSKATKQECGLYSVLTVDVEAPGVLDLAGRHDGVLGAAAQHLAHVGRLRLVAQRALRHVARVGGLRGTNRW